ncbi:hypothetical protein J1605_021079 [Eschrichtius robustus]|uniref:Uncharacterized protein n=1 Tax=Eschrichtius robustus TaxID=9764 RepID=A0AB34HJ93_ESCRO|nr:hypothetical protein J1605_021079 [Eschrichtius robustus]
MAGESLRLWNWVKYQDRHFSHEKQGKKHHKNGAQETPAIRKANVSLQPEALRPFLVVHTSLSQDGFQSKGFWKVRRHTPRTRCTSGSLNPKSYSKDSGRRSLAKCGNTYRRPWKHQEAGTVGEWLPSHKEILFWGPRLHTKYSQLLPKCLLVATGNSGQNSDW